MIGNDGGNFSAGANIAALLMMVGAEEWDAVKQMVREFQAVNQRLRYLSMPVVTAPFQLTLGGGAEVTMAGNAMQAPPSSYMGLVEVGVGLIPGGGGNMMLMRNVFGAPRRQQGLRPAALRQEGSSSPSAPRRWPPAPRRRSEACFLKDSDGISMNRDHQLADAKARVLGMAEAGFRPPRASPLLPAGHERRGDHRHDALRHAEHPQIASTTG